MSNLEDRDILNVRKQEMWNIKTDSGLTTILIKKQMNSAR